jgi:hypothetical protein
LCCIASIYTGKYSKPVRKVIECILAKDWNITTNYVLGNEHRKLLAWARLIEEKLKNAAP